MAKPAFEWREKILSVGGALILVALPVLLLPRPQYAWILALLGASLLLVALVAIVLDRKAVSVKARLLAPWQRLKHLGLRSPLYIQQPPLPPPNTESKQKGVDLADLAYAGLEMKLRQHDNVIRYGNIQLRHLPRLTDSDLMFLNKEMRDLRPIVWEAGESIRVLLLTLLHFLSNTGGNDARYWVAEELKASHLPRAERVLARFDEQVEAGVDSREALAAFQAHYFKSMEWSERMASFLEQPLDSFAEFSNWRVRHGQYVEVFKRKLELPQFEVLKHWYYSSKTMRSLPLLF
jgi:hypothetical protein